jgi:hypothetical protein
MAEPEAFVGAVVSLKLVNGTEMRGTVFTYDSANCAIVLVENPAAERPNMKLINTCFVSEITVQEKDPKDPKDKLPVGIAREATLPSLAGNDSLQKRMNKALNKAEERRRYDSAGRASLSIAACQLFDRLTLSLGAAMFSSDKEHLDRAQALAKRQNATVGLPTTVILINSVLVSDNGGEGGYSWENPIVGDLKEGDDNASLVARVKSAVSAAFR